MKQLTEREIVQKRAMKQGSCMCSKLFKCPCKYFRDTYKCHCAGDMMPISMIEWIEYNTK